MEGPFLWKYGRMVTEWRYEVSVPQQAALEMGVGLPHPACKSRLQTAIKVRHRARLSRPLLANLFLHYAFDAWVRRELPDIPFCRYADDGLLHCRSRLQAEYVMRRISERFRQCGLEIHPDKSSIVYCKDANRTGDYARITFDFLGYHLLYSQSRQREEQQGYVHDGPTHCIYHLQQRISEVM